MILCVKLLVFSMISVSSSICMTSAVLINGKVKGMLPKSINFTSCQDNCVREGVFTRELQSNHDFRNLPPVDILNLLNVYDHLLKFRGYGSECIMSLSLLSVDFFFLCAS